MTEYRLVLIADGDVTKAEPQDEMSIPVPNEESQ